MESDTSVNTILHKSKHLQQIAAMKAAENIAQIQHSPTEDTLKKKAPLATFQLPKNAIPDNAGHIKVSSLQLVLTCGLLTTIHLQEALWFHIQLFGRLLQKGAIIGPTPPDVHNKFNRFFNCLEDVTAIHDNTTASTALGPKHHHISIL